MVFVCVCVRVCVACVTVATGGTWFGLVRVYKVNLMLFSDCYQDYAGRFSVENAGLFFFGH